MGGKKKKGLSNRLAKMSDEERARYLQHRAAIEEEARRRKELLIATYMKNKLKREEAFTRLNIAKLNEQWHQILRKLKVKELKTEIKDLSAWITHILEIKNSIIKKLLQELEEAEDQYVYNLQSHLSHLDNFLGIHDQRQIDLEHDFAKHKQTLVDDARTEMDRQITQADNDEEYLKIILFTIETNFKDIQKQLKMFRDNSLEDQSNSGKAEQETMVKSYSTTMDNQWRDINSILSEYLARTTIRRHHYIELKHLDERNTRERLDNERRITRYTDQINSLNIEYELLTYENETQLKECDELKKTVSENFRKTKQNCSLLIRKDEKQLEYLTVTSNNAIKNLEAILAKGTSVLQWLTYCRRLETEDEKLFGWAKIHKKLDQFEDISLQSFEIGDGSPKREESEEEKKEMDANSDNASKAEENSNIDGSKVKEDSEKEDGLKSEELSKADDVSEDIHEKSIEPSELLEKLSGLCWCFNRTEIDYVQLKNEKRAILAENEYMKEIIKSILKDAALDPPTQATPENNQIQYKIIPAPAVVTKQMSFIVIDL